MLYVALGLLAYFLVANGRYLMASPAVGGIVALIFVVVGGWLVVTYFRMRR
jgi:hypothetical protein